MGGAVPAVISNTREIVSTLTTKHGGGAVALLPQAPAFHQSIYFQMQSHDYLPKCWSKAVNGRVQNTREGGGKRVYGDIYGSQCRRSAIVDASGERAVQKRL